MAMIKQCDRCKKPIVDFMTDYYVQLEEWNHNGFYTDQADGIKRAQLCPECYKQIMTEVL